MDKDSQQLATLISATREDLRHIGDKTFSFLEKIMATLDDIVAKVKAERDVVDSAIVLISGFKDKLDACVASGADPAVLQKLSDDLGDSTAKLAAAVAANTSAETPAPAPEGSPADIPAPTADPASASPPADQPSADPAPVEPSADGGTPSNPPA